MKQQPKIMAALMMLLVTAVALTSASYAWFSTNTSVLLSGLDVNVTASNGIQLSLDAINWSAALSSIQIMDSHTLGGTTYPSETNQIPTTFAPVSTIGSQTAGIYDMFNGEIIPGTPDTLTTTLLTDASGTTGQYMAFDVFLLTTEALAIELNAGSAVIFDGATDTGLQYSARVGFIDMGTDTTNTPATAQALSATNEQTLWEPNADQHTDFAVSNLGAVNGTEETYYGVMAAGTGLSLSKAAQASDTTHFDLIEADPGIHNLIQSDEGSVPLDTIFTTGIGITKVRIYIWIEGQDIDCENTASLGTGITATISFKKP